MPPPDLLPSTTQSKWGANYSDQILIRQVFLHKYGVFTDKTHSGTDSIAAMSQQTILQVAVPTPLRKSFDYLMPGSLPDLFSTINNNDHQVEVPQPGSRVLVPFGNQQLTGIVLATKTSADVDTNKLKSIISVLDEKPVLSNELLQLVHWITDYYQHPIGECFSTALPNLLRKGQALISEAEIYWQLCKSQISIEDLPKQAKAQRALISYLSEHSLLLDSEKKSICVSAATLKTLAEKGLIESIEKLPVPQLNVPVLHSNIKLNHEQAPLIESFNNRSQGFESILLEGVTGSGKTEVYLQLIETTLKQGRQALVLVPEIGLTPQTLSRFEKRFDCPLAIFHSNLSDKQRLLHWQQSRSGVARIIIGTRSAIFTATDNLGLIIIDEEHDLSYKQQDGLRYSARDLACVRAKLEDIPIVLGSATPTLETLHNAEQGKFTHWQLTERAGNAQQPEIHLLDIRNQPMVDGIAESVLPEVEDCLSRGEQALIFINRRGFAPSLICHDCGWVSQCHACDARLTIHLGARHLRCHHCQSIEPIPNQCPDCQSNELVYTGAGTERIEKSLQQQFPDTALYRIDRDTTSNKNAMSEMLANIHNNDAAILVGTQMLAKGHHFPNVTLVLVLDADGALMGTDYRAMERFGQLLTQVTGRAGREEKMGKAIIQTHYPDHIPLNKLVNHGYHRFAMDILAERQQLNLPPFTYQALVRLEDKDALNGLQTLEQLKYAIGLQPCHCIGPFPASLQRRAHFYRYQLLISSDKRVQLKQSISALLNAADKIIKPHKQRWSIDIDPQDMS